jgi:secondary thiamine-phosphate synthase enzyme
MITQFSLKLKAFPKGIHLITRDIINNINQLPESGLLNIFLQHTSAGLSINENADPSVRVDLEAFLDKTIPESSSYFTHTFEGSDDMPAHIKTSLFGNSLTIPIVDHKLALGIWQGVYLGEFRNNGGSRNLIITIYS